MHIYALLPIVSKSKYNGDVKLVSELTRNEIIKEYPKLKNINDLFESDILIFPDIKQKGVFRGPLKLDMKNEYENLKVKYYSHDQDNLRLFYTDSVQEIENIINLGVVVVSNINGLIAIAEFLLNKYEGISKINIQLFNKTVNNTYIQNIYEGDVNNFCNHEIETMEADFKNHEL